LADAERPNVIVFLTDDQGWADLGVQGIESDIKTPNIDRMANEGIRFTQGYVSAPQCSPSRAGLLSGQYQVRFGFDDNRFSPLSRDVTLLPQRLQRMGYKTGIAGKWHLELNHFSSRWLKAHQPQLEAVPGVEEKIPFDELIEYFPQARGFDDAYSGYENEWWINYDLEGNTLEEPRYVTSKDYRLDVTSEAALTFIDRHRGNPFFLYVSYYAPHIPMEATQKYLDRFPRSAGSGQAGDMPERRRYCLAMMSAVDDGVGRILDRLETYGLDENTLIFFLSDNGAPLKIDKEDRSIPYTKGGAWDGSLNGPLNGEKGMLSEGGIRVPFVAWWKSRIPGGQVIEDPVISLDISATVLGLTEKGTPGNADGVNLMPLMTGEVSHLEERNLYWKFKWQQAVRKGRWKYLKAGKSTDFLFDIDADPSETKNLITLYPEVANSLKEDLEDWMGGMMYPDYYNNKPVSGEDRRWYKHYFGVDLK
jgi:arylsulfatase A-like enzyme